MELAVRNARASDTLFVQHNVDEGDLDRAIQKLGLESDSDFLELMKNHSNLVR